MSELVACQACGEPAPQLRFCDQCGEPMAAAPAGRPGAPLPSADETRAAAADPGACLLVARRYAEAGKLGEFLREHAAAPPRFLDAYARAFLRLGQLRAAMALLGSKSPPDPVDRELRNILAEAIRESEAPGLFKGAHVHRGRLGAAVRLGERGFFAEALALADEELIRQAAADETESLQVARVFSAAGKASDFLLLWAPGRDGAFYSAYARAFFTLERYAEALELLGKKPQAEAADFPVLVGCRGKLGSLDGLAVSGVPEAQRAELAKALLDRGEDRLALSAVLDGRTQALGRAEFALALRACRRLSDGSTAERLYPALRGRFPLRQDPELHYQFALCCESWGAVGRARQVYRELLESLGAYRDTAARLAQIESMSPEDSSRLSVAVSAAAGPPAGPRAEAGAARPGAAGTDAGPAAGSLLAGRFEVRRPLGIGGMGVVVQGFDRALPRLVAIKKMRGSLAPDPSARERFLQEARTVAGLNHPYLVAIHDILATPEGVHLVFEFVDGETLHELLASRGRLTPPQCAAILKDVCEALAYAHDNGVIHRDLKPSNVMVSRHGHAKVMDFGIAKLVSAGAEDTPHVAGTPLYMAPEQHSGAATALSDVFSLGAMAYELLAGQAPFTGPDFAAQKLRERYVPLPADLPEGLRALVSSCLKAEPAARPQGMRKVLAALASLPLARSPSPAR